MLALDAMGGDHAPRETVAGAAEAVRRGIDVVLVGDRRRLEPLCDDVDVDLPIVDAGDVVEMGEDPARSIREKPDASISVAARLVRSGEADGLVSAGSTGAALAAAAIIIGRIPGVLRPAIATVIPTDPPTVLVDAGANPTVGPRHLLQFAIMGSVVSEVSLGVADPSVGLLSIGHEKGKGRDLEKQAAVLLENALTRFVGNVEGRDVTAGTVNVVVTDGFTGNTVLKAIEGAVTWVASLAACAGAPLPTTVLAGIDYETTGGAHLVGTRGVAVIAHGSSSRVAIRSALEWAAHGASGGMVEEIERRLA
ncbi:MAG TPA: phosphate acyltransferase PlsX [Actinobacteria bacterium]|nr:phosphate acyltransferase [bacterium BMS3Bbin01]HDH27212.1 phosphate acyltransferase PlsX [Actinomycetota bacterium]